MSRPFRFSPLQLLLVLAPISVVLRFAAPERHVVIFATSVLALLPLSAYIGKATNRSLSISVVALAVS
jgi:hypothetical protein